MKIEADRDVCIGAGMCVMTAEEVFDQDDDGIVVVLEVEVPAEHADSAAPGRGELPVRGPATDRRLILRCAGGSGRPRVARERGCSSRTRSGKNRHCEPPAEWSASCESFARTHRHDVPRRMSPPYL